MFNILLCRSKSMFHLKFPLVSKVQIQYLWNSGCLCDQIRPCQFAIFRNLNIAPLKPKDERNKNNRTKTKDYEIKVSSATSSFVSLFQKRNDGGTLPKAWESRTPSWCSKVLYISFKSSVSVYKHVFRTTILFSLWYYYIHFDDWFFNL